MRLFGRKKATRKAPPINKKHCGKMVFDKNGNGHRCGKPKGHWGSC